MAPELSDRILVWSFSNTDSYTLETCDWYNSDSIGSVYLSTSQFIEKELDNFYADFSDWFNLAEFPDIGERLEPSEATVFLRGAGAPDDTDFSARSKANYNCFSGLRGVIRHRLDQRSLDQIKLAANLFNWTIDCGLFLADTTSKAVLTVGPVEEAAPFLLERILHRLPSIDKRRNPAYQPRPSSVEMRFLPLAPLLTMLQETVESADWVQNHLALEIFFWIVEMYKAEVEKES